MIYISWSENNDIEKQGKKGILFIWEGKLFKQCKVHCELFKHKLEIISKHSICIVKEAYKYISVERYYNLISLMALVGTVHRWLWNESGTELVYVSRAGYGLT